MRVVANIFHLIQSQKQSCLLKGTLSSQTHINTWPLKKLCWRQEKLNPWDGCPKEPCAWLLDASLGNRWVPARLLISRVSERWGGQGVAALTVGNRSLSSPSGVVNVLPDPRVFRRTLKEMLAPFTNSKLNLKCAQEVCVVHSRPKHHQSKAT